jgi:hypothetical protein
MQIVPGSGGYDNIGITITWESAFGAQRTVVQISQNTGSSEKNSNYSEHEVNAIEHCCSITRMIRVCFSPPLDPYFCGNLEFIWRLLAWKRLTREVQAKFCSNGQGKQCYTMLPTNGFQIVFVNLNITSPPKQVLFLVGSPCY